MPRLKWSGGYPGHQDAGSGLCPETASKDFQTSLFQLRPTSVDWDRLAGHQEWKKRLVSLGRFGQRNIEADGRRITRTSSFFTTGILSFGSFPTTLFAASGATAPVLYGSTWKCQLWIVQLKIHTIPWDSHARSQETPPAYRPHWRGQSPQNPVEDVLSSPGDRKTFSFVLFSHPYVIVPVENLRGQNIPLTVLFLPTIAHVGSVILIQNCKIFTILQFKVNVERWTWLPGFMMSITSNSFFLIVRTIKIFCCSFSSWGVFRLMTRQRSFFYYSLRASDVLIKYSFDFNMLKNVSQINI